MDLGDSEWLLWLALALGAGIAEVLSLNLVFLMIAGGGVAAAVAAALGAGVPVELLVFAVVTALLLSARARRCCATCARACPAATNTGGVVGREAEVLVPVTPVGGRVRLARRGLVGARRRVVPGQSGYPLEVGSAVQVVRIDGATAVVAPRITRAGITGAALPERAYRSPVKDLP